MLWSIDHQSRVPLQDQIAGCVRRAVSEGALTEGEQLPPAAELAEALTVDRNTVLAAYRRLRDDGVLEFRRGRGARVCGGSAGRAAVDQAARALVDVAREHGYGRADVIRLIKEMP
jgi:DNA-binding transcriptional regulator YhcF (GntR family)